MQIVIDIPEQLISELNDDNYNAIIKWYDSTLYHAIKTGTVLPEGHGRLIDISKYENNFFNVAISYDDGSHIHEKYTSELPTIIEADKEKEE